MEGLSRITLEGTLIRAQAGASLMAVCAAARDAGLTGLEFAYGIPGQVGGDIAVPPLLLRQVADPLPGGQPVPEAPVAGVQDLFLGDARLPGHRGRPLLVMASMHRVTFPQGTTPEERTAAWCAAAKNPRVDVIGHLGDPRFSVDYEAVIRAFPTKAPGKALTPPAGR